MTNDNDDNEREFTPAERAVSTKLAEILEAFGKEYPAEDGGMPFVQVALFGTPNGANKQAYCLQVVTHPITDCEKLPNIIQTIVYGIASCFKSVS